MRPYLQLLSTDLINRILAEAKRILHEVGFEIRGNGLRQRLLDYGLPTDAKGERILFPPDVVEWAIQQTPRSFTLYNRDGLPHADIGGDKVHFVPASSGLKLLDHRTQAVRPPLTADFVEYVRLADGLSNIAYLATAFSTDDIEADISDAWRLYLCLITSRKPIVSGAFTEHGVPRMAEMMQLFRHNRQDLIARPLSIFTITATGNFRYSEDSCQNLLDCVEWGIPIEIVPVTLMGLIAPVTLIGATVFHTADVLAGITMAQIVRPSAPVLFGGAPAEFHMKEATSPMLGLEALRLDMAYVEVGKTLGLPTQSYMALSDSKFLDAQAGAESFGSALLAALAGVNSVSGPGMLDFVMTFSLPKLVFDDELCGQALRFVRESQIINDLPTVELARALLEEQHLITADHTMSHWQTQLYLPSQIYDRTTRENYAKRGGLDLRQRCTADVEKRLKQYQPVETDSAIRVEMERLIRTGLNEDSPLPEIPPAKPTTTSSTSNRPPGQRRSAKRRRGKPIG